MPPNTVAQIYALQNNTSVLSKLTGEEKNLMPNLNIEKPITVRQKVSKALKTKSLTSYLTYQTDKSFIKDHILETNKTYTYQCYTAAFILCRKIIENLITDVIKKKFPKKIELYFDISRGRRHDFSIVLSNLGRCSKDFGFDKDLVERIVFKCHPFKDDANSKTHSWYHVVKSKKELDEHNVPDIIEMISQLNENIDSS